MVLPLWHQVGLGDVLESFEGPKETDEISKYRDFGGLNTIRGMQALPTPTNKLAKNQILGVSWLHQG